VNTYVVIYQPVGRSDESATTVVRAYGEAHAARLAKEVGRKRYDVDTVHVKAVRPAFSPTGRS